MPEHSNIAERPCGPNQFAAAIVGDATGDEVHLATPAESESGLGKNPHAVALGRLGGLKGGPARAKKLSRERRREIAKRAAEARWDKP